MTSGAGPAGDRSREAGRPAGPAEVEGGARPPNAPSAGERVDRHQFRRSLAGICPGIVKSPGEFPAGPRVADGGCALASAVGAVWKVPPRRLRRL